MRMFRSDDGAAAMLRLPPGADLLEGMTEAVRELGIRAGTVQIIGAVRKLVLGYFDQDAREYRTIEPGGHFEVASGIGNVSIKEGEPFVHVHLVCTAEDGSAVGGHLMPGTEAFAAEVYLRALGGEAPEREEDEQTGLALWPPSSG